MDCARTLAGLLTACLTFLLTPAAYSQADLSGTYRIQTVGSGRLWHEGGADNQLVSTRSWVDDDFTRFTLERQQDGSYRIKVKGAGLYLHEDGNGDKLLSVRYKSDDDFTRFFFEPQSDGSFRIKVKADGQYLHEDGNGDKRVSTRYKSNDVFTRFKLLTPDSTPENITVAPSNPAAGQPVAPSNPAAGQPVAPSNPAAGQPYDTATAPSEQLRLNGEKPQIVAVFIGDALYVAWQRYSAGKPQGARLTRFDRTADGFRRAWDRDLPLDLLAGMAGDGANLYYVLTAKAENLASETTLVTFRPNVLMMTKFDSQGGRVWQRDLNNSDYLGDAVNGEFGTAIFSPLQSGTGAVTFGNDKLLVTVASNTLPDRNINQRHQRAQYFVMSANGAGYKAEDETSWRHSFDQRLLFDGQDFIFMDLADAGWYMPGAGISLRKIKPTADGANFSPAGEREGVYIYARQAETAGGQNWSFTTLGDIQPGTRGYVALFASEKSNNIRDRNGWNQPVAEPRNLALVHVRPGFDGVRDARPGAQGSDTGNANPNDINITSNVVDSPGHPATFSRPGQQDKTFTQAGIVWLTDCPSGVSVERPKLLKVGDDRYIALWEEWTYNGTTLNYQSTKAMLVSEYGQILQPATPINARLNPGGADQPFLLKGQAAWIVGDARGGKFILCSIDQDLTLRTTDIGL